MANNMARGPSGPPAPTFEWDLRKDRLNRLRHGVGFDVAQRAFLDPQRVIAEDLAHSRHEVRYFCFGKVDEDILTVRFTWRAGVVRIFGAGNWRKGRHVYEAQNRTRRTGR